ncbi:LysR family transcriptional regulator [Shewanella waksmanii]|uniref:LysR family transcriptional regulator n=1 Tax=Shewanella waksmanii TaxID=213783 RepID=UPI003736382F
MDIKVFKTFLEVVREKHFGRAADNLYITQAAVSARIKQLEAFFDTTLFVRDRNAIKLTSAGERLVPYGETMVRTLDQAKTELLLTKDYAVQLTIAGTPNIWDAFLQHWLSVVTEELQGYSFCAEVLSLEQMTRAQMERTLDIGVSFDPMKTDEIASQQVAMLELVLVCSQPQSASNALTQGYVYVDWGTRFASEHAERHAKMPPPYLRTSNGQIALNFILEKGGAAYLPRVVVTPFLESGQLYEVDAQQPWYRPVYLSYRKDAVAIKAISKVARLIDKTEPLTPFVLQQAGDSNDAE